MPELIGGGTNPPYNTQIPSISDDADIQTAFRLYHYGSNTSTPGSLPANSLALILARTVGRVLKTSLLCGINDATTFPRMSDPCTSIVTRLNRWSTCVTWYLTGELLGEKTT